MKLFKSIATFTILSLFISSLTSSTRASVDNFCVADLRYPKGPEGYPCKDHANVRVDDFVFSGLRAAKNKSAINGFNFSATFASDKIFPGINGLGLSIARFDLPVGQVVPIHTHRASEIAHVVEGSLIIGFVDSYSTTYRKTLNKGDVMVIPGSLPHFQEHVGDVTTTVFSSFDSVNPSPVFASTKLTAKQKSKNISGGIN